jgi:hypothetical protein
MRGSDSNLGLAGSKKASSTRDSNSQPRITTFPTTPYHVTAAEQMRHNKHKSKDKRIAQVVRRGAWAG